MICYKFACSDFLVSGFLHFRLPFHFRHSYPVPHPETSLPSRHHSRWSRSWEGPRAGQRSVPSHHEHHPTPGCQATYLHHGDTRGPVPSPRDKPAHCGFEIQLRGASGCQPSCPHPSHPGSTEEARRECGGSEGDHSGATVLGGWVVSACLPHQPSHQTCPGCHHYSCDH